MFSQAPDQAASTNAGLGGGLALVRDLTVAQGGKVRADSAGPNQGATFTVWLPLAKNKPEEKKPAVSTGPLRDLRILGVDDMVELLEPFAALLRLEGAQVEAASSGQRALELLARPLHNGYPALKRSKLIKPPTASTRISFFCTSQRAHVNEGLNGRNTDRAFLVTNHRFKTG